MSRRNSLSEKIGKYFGYLASYSSPNLFNKETQEIHNHNHRETKPNPTSDHPSMAHPGPNPQPPPPPLQPHHAIRSKHKHKRNDLYATKNFDKIDYIVQIPLIDNPNERQTRFLLAMDYTLSPRDGLGIMDTALEHIVHYFDMNKAELIFCEMWQSVCLFIEFRDTDKCQEAYNQLFQFFKTIFYVEDLNALEELWICSHCKHYNQFDEYLRGLNTINDKRKDSKGDEYIYWCNRCKNVNHNTYKKIKYSYQRAKKNRHHTYIKSNRDQIGSISKPNHVPPSYYRKRRHSNARHRHRSSTDPEHKQAAAASHEEEEADDEKKHNANHASLQPQWRNANSQPVASTSSIYAQIRHRDTHHHRSKEDEEETAGPDIIMGQAHGHLRFNIPQNKKLNVLVPSKSMDCLKDHIRNNNNHNRASGAHARHSSAISGVSSSPEIVSPASSASMPPKDLPFGLNIHGKKYSVDSAISVASTTSTVSSIDNNLDLCCTILETIEQETKGLKGSAPLIYDESVTRGNVHQLDVQQTEVMRKIARLSSMLVNIENTFTAAMDQHKHSMAQALDDCKEEEPMHTHHRNVVRASHASVYKGGNNDNNNNNDITPCGDALTSQNLYNFQQQQQILSDEDKYTHSAPQQYDDEDIASYSDYNHNLEDDDLETPAGTDVLLMGQAHGNVQFNFMKLPPPHHK